MVFLACINLNKYHITRINVNTGLLIYKKWVVGSKVLGSEVKGPGQTYLISVLPSGSGLRVLKHKFQSVGKRYAPSWSVLPVWVGIQMRLTGSRVQPLVDETVEA